MQKAEVVLAMLIRNGWGAGYIERCKSGSEGGTRKPVPVTRKGAGCLPYPTDTLDLLPFLERIHF